ncbi:MAG TPA: MFS transporter [Verrucomicrobiae bacterium]|nr:MFS transporter [Verrucomicrobiae bacterium]
MAAPHIDRSAWSWALYEAARNPYVLLCTIYVMAPYVATTVIGDPVQGQAIISSWHKTAGLIVAVTAPFLGAAMDRMGRRKPILGVVTAGMVAAFVAQWWAMPGGAGLPLWALGGVLVFAGVMFSFSEVAHNSMLTTAAKPDVLGHVSGLGLALGNMASVLLLVFVLFAFALPGVIALPFVPDAPLFGLDPAAFEPNRIVGPLSGLWLALLALPLFFFARDLDTTGEKFGDAMRHGVGKVVGTIRKLRDHRNVALFLVARMLYADGKTAILIFSGVYAAGVMGWDLLEMLTLGVVTTAFGVIGGLSGGHLDAWLGPKRAVAIEIGLTFVCLLVMVSMTPTSMFFVVPVAEGAVVWDGPLFQSPPEMVYLLTTCVIAISISAAYASSRTLMARLSPAGMEGELFGLYALSGAATVWLGPLLVEHFTETYQSQRAGFAAISILLIVGFVLLLFVKPPPQSSSNAPPPH